MTKFLEHLLGDRPLRLVIKLAVISLLVGMALNRAGWTPVDVVSRLWAFIVRLWNMGFSAFDTLFDVLLVGAAVVVPIFIIMRLLSRGQD